MGLIIRTELSVNAIDRYVIHLHIFYRDAYDVPLLPMRYLFALTISLLLFLVLFHSFSFIVVFYLSALYHVRH